MKTGVIGLGAMGTGMAMNFHKVGVLHAVWNRTTSKAVDIGEQTKALVCESPEQLAAECELIIVCVSRDSDVIEMIERVATTIKADAIVVDTSTVSSDTAKQAAALLQKANAHFLDCPVSGGTEGAKNGALAMMAGGDESILERARSTLDAITKSIVHIGPCGSGQACKAVNQIICAGLYETVAEALSFGAAAGLDLEKVVEVVSGGAAANWVLDNRSSFMLNNSYPPGFKVNLHLKDLNICKQMAKDMGIENMPITEQTMRDYETLIEQGYSEEDVSSVFRLKQRKA
ncbi:MAG: 3-hydroxyisobutyrate dehydrogenase [Gammaproteobacteria bacterium]|jgi:3-hydroxyisobutyrate dehydrogenase